ncbi:Hypothetical protein CINCED_3A020752 [Cinara cedri]|uniref:Uncharacterized protein n=1 Tax=Cinara cedri TaxID=506608 RepID=A0A5E4M8R5_9HEMI|nr:Hypothetical protein CINCED_3A020752 [Cinara cedri]
MFGFIVKSQNANKMMADFTFTSSDHAGRLRIMSVYFWLTLLALCQCLYGKPTIATAHRWSLAELSVTSSELPKQIPAPPYPQQQRIQSTPHYDQQLKLPSAGNEIGPRHQHYPWTRPTASII